MSSQTTVTAWRLVKRSRAENAFDGEGAFRFGGRWNSRGQRMVYASRTLSLALLEILVHLDPARTIPELVAIKIQIPLTHVEKGRYSNLSDMDKGLPWPLRETRLAGDQWLSQARRPVLKVPSVIIPLEHNFLLNPTHPDFKRCRLSPPQLFNFDRRLVQA